MEKLSKKSQTREALKKGDMAKKKENPKSQLIIIELHPEVYEKFKDAAFAEKSTMKEMLVDFVKKSIEKA
jgi:hypothetical protein